MYVCGPTVYSDAHIGHAMAAIVFDMVRRYLTYRGYRVALRHQLHRRGRQDHPPRQRDRARTPSSWPTTMPQEYLRHLNDLNVLPADVYPRVSQEMDWIVQLHPGLGEERLRLSSSTATSTFA